jgi:outer membrane protein insertion porin family
MASAVRDRLGEQGYVFADVDVEQDIDEERHQAHITLIVDRGRKQHLGDVRFEGDLETKRRFLRKRIPMCEGQVITRSQLEKGLSAVYRVGAFGTMEHTLVPRSPDTSDLVVRLQEAENKRVDFGIGWGSWEMLRGTATYRNFNFTGEGRYLQATGIASIRHLGLDVLVEDPWILGDRNVLSARIGILRREERFYKFWGINTEVYVERELDDHWRVRGGYWFNAKDAFNVDPGIPAGDLDEIEGFSRSAGLFVRARWDRRDHLFVPTTGWFTEGRVSWSTPPLGANLSYVELRLRHTHFFNLGDVGVLAFHNHFASKQILDDRPTLPIQERYFLGGSESVRCFGQDQLTPVDSARSGVGGLTAYTGSLEWRVKLVGDLYAGLFVDWGMVALPSFSFNGVWGYGPGAGLRYYTPVGPVRFDLAYNPGDLLAATSRWQFHFAFGFAF